MTTLTVQPSDPLARDEAFLDWLCAYNIEPKDTFKVEISTDTMLVHQFVRDDRGRVRHDHGDPEVRTLTVEVITPPPVEEDDG